MGYSDKYGYVATTRHGRSGPIGEDEPVALIRAQDDLAVPTLRYYRERCVVAGSPDDHIESIDHQISNFTNWQHKNPTRTPGTAKRT
jgi:hypothetical protein